MLYFRELWALRDMGMVLGTTGWNSHQNQPSPDEQSSDLAGTHCFHCPRDRLIHCSCPSEKPFTLKNLSLQKACPVCCETLLHSAAAALLGTGREGKTRYRSV